jgi:hypothetical protein
MFIEKQPIETVTNTDVIIVGAGPTGLSLACQLVRYGIDFAIVDRKIGVTTHSKALGVQARTMEIYEQLGVAQLAIDLGQIAGKIRIIAEGKVRGQVDLSDMGQDLSPYPYLFVLEQSKLDTYNEERLPNAQRLLETTDRAFNVLVGSNWFFSFMRMKILTLVAKYAIGRDLVGKNIFSAISQIRINYRKNSLSQHDGDAGFKIEAGDRMPYFLIDGESIYDRLHAPKFHLLVFSDSEHRVRNLQRELEQESGDLIEFNVIPLSPQISAIFGTDRPFQLLLRPDNYIGFISTAASLTDLKTYIHEVLGYP